MACACRTSLRSLATASCVRETSLAEGQEGDVDVAGATLARVVATAASRALSAAADDVHGAIAGGLEDIGRAVGADRAALLSFDVTTSAVSMVEEWCAPGVAPVGAALAGVTDDATRWWSARVLLSEPIVITDVGDVDDHDGVDVDRHGDRGDGNRGDGDGDGDHDGAGAGPFARLLRAEGNGSLLLVPVVLSGQPRGPSAV